MITQVFSTRWGSFEASFSEVGLCHLKFPSFPRQTLERTTPAPSHRWGRPTREAILAVLAGRVPRSLPPLDLNAGTMFQRRVWKALMQIPRGQTRTYGELAAAVECPRACRAVGAACGANPLPLIIPCHRVLAANRRLGGYSAGCHWKRFLLEREGIQLVSPR